MPSAILDNDEKYEKLLNLYKELKKIDNNNNEKAFKVTIADNILEGLNWLTESRDEDLLKKLSEYNNHKFMQTNQTFPNLDQDENINVLITGSLYLVGLTLKVLNFKID